MLKTHYNKLSYIVPIIALIIIILQIIMVKTDNLSKWKGGGFGMYSEIHYSHNEVWIKNNPISIDSLVKRSRKFKALIKILKITPNKKNLYKVAQLIAKQIQRDTIILQVWKPQIDINKSTYHRKLISEIKYID